MVAPTGVHEELPGDPAKSGTRAGTAGAEPSQAEGTGEKAGPAAVVPAQAVPQQAEPLGEEAKPAGAEPVEAELAIAEPTEAEAAEADRDAEEGGRDISPLAVIGIIFGVI